MSMKIQSVLGSPQVMVNNSPATNLQNPPLTAWSQLLGRNVKMTQVWSPLSCCLETRVQESSQCANLPVSMNEGSHCHAAERAGSEQIARLEAQGQCAKHPKGCPGAVYSNGDPSKQYCEGDWSGSGRFPWWEPCCEWKQSVGCRAKSKCHRIGFHPPAASAAPVAVDNPTYCYDSAERQRGLEAYSGVMCVMLRWAPPPRHDSQGIQLAFTAMLISPTRCTETTEYKTCSAVTGCAVAGYQILWSVDGGLYEASIVSRPPCHSLCNGQVRVNNTHSTETELMISGLQEGPP